MFENVQSTNTPIHQL